MNNEVAINVNSVVPDGMRVSTVRVIPLFGQAVNKKGLACYGCGGGG